MRFSNRGVIVTGAAQGIGLACAARFAAEGANVVIADIDEAAGTAAAEKLGHEHAGTCHFLRTDVGDSASVAAMVSRALELAGRLDVLVNNAGIVRGGDFLDISEADFDAVMRVNIKGMFLVGQAVARAMAKAGGGAIVNMSSINAEVAIPDQVPYCVAKGGVNQLTRVMALSLAPHGIRVNAIAPGSIATEMLRTVVLTNEAARAKILQRTPLGRPGEPEEIAAVAAFLAGEDAGYMTGEVVTVDGGRMALNYTVPVPDPSAGPRRDS